MPIGNWLFHGQNTIDVKKAKGYHEYKLKYSKENIMNRLNTQKKVTEPVAVSVRNFLHYLLHCLICIYIVLILGVLPFYFTDGYNRIGTDKAIFSVRSVCTMQGCLLPFCCVTLSLFFGHTVRKGRMERYQGLCGKNWKRICLLRMCLRLCTV